MSDGFIFWTPHMQWVTSCSVNLRKFPFDVQTCEIILVNWMYQESQLRYKIFDDRAQFEAYYIANNQWELVSLSSRQGVFKGKKNISQGLPSLTLELSMKRYVCIPHFLPRCKYCLKDNIAMLSQCRRSISYGNCCYR